MAFGKLLGLQGQMKEMLFQASEKAAELYTDRTVSKAVA